MTAVKIFHGTKDKDIVDVLPFDKIGTYEISKYNGILSGLGTFWTDNKSYAEEYAMNDDEILVGTVLEKEIDLDKCKAIVIEDYYARDRIMEEAGKFFKKQNNLPDEMDDEMIYKEMYRIAQQEEMPSWAKDTIGYNKLCREALVAEGYDIAILIGDKQCKSNQDRVFILLK